MNRSMKISANQIDNGYRLPIRTASMFSKEHIRMLNEVATTKQLEENEYLFQEGAVADRIFFVHSGSVKLYRMLKEEAASTMALYFTGDLFGEMNTAAHVIHQHRAVAMEKSVVGEIMQKDVNALIRSSGQFAEAFVAWSGLMNRITQSKLRDFLHYGKSGALCALLLRLANTYPAERGGNRYIDKRITNADMAGMISATRESVNRLLGDLKEKKIISMMEGKIVLHNIPYLKKVCNCDNCPIEICRM
ncbi:MULTISPECIES: Crp/Fnr family transcriptional regulator [unclassified Paenibacillus]|uniref:Crp/Fnr family transcriptional regulator n=1 Tax=unclassified Paenibacillus TaxID=185978 RepID=UPI002F41B4DA